jgi:hypothetical protein
MLAAPLGPWTCSMTVRRKPVDGAGGQLLDVVQELLDGRPSREPEQGDQHQYGREEREQTVISQRSRTVGHVVMLELLEGTFASARARARQACSCPEAIYLAFPETQSNRPVSRHIVRHGEAAPRMVTTDGDD